MSGDRFLIHDQNGIYFLTFTVVQWLDVFSRPSYKNIIVDSLNFCIERKGLVVFAWCLMSSHLHMIASAKDGFKLSEIIRDFKKFTAVSIIQKIKEGPESRRELFLSEFLKAGLKDKRITNYKFWQESNHAIQLMGYETKIIDQKLQYIHQNPVEQGIVAFPEDYLYSSAKDYADDKGLIQVELL